MCHDVTQYGGKEQGKKRVQHEMISTRSLSFILEHEKRSKDEGKCLRDREKAKIDNLIKLIIWFRWNHHHHFSLTGATAFDIQRILLHHCLQSNRAISQNMPTIVYQTNRYWLSDAADNTGDSWRKLISSLWQDKNVMSH